MHIQLDPVRVQLYCNEKQTPNLSLSQVCYLPVHSDGSVGSEHHFLYQLLLFVSSGVLTLSIPPPHTFAHLLKDGLILISGPFNASVSSQSGQEGPLFSQGDLNEFNFSRGNTKMVTVLYCCCCSCWEVHFISRLV